MKKGLISSLKKAVVGTLAGASLFASGCAEMNQITPLDIVSAAMGVRLETDENLTYEQRVSGYALKGLVDKQTDREHDYNVHNQRNTNNNYSREENKKVGSLPELIILNDYVDLNNNGIAEENEYLGKGRRIFREDEPVNSCVCNHGYSGEINMQFEDDKGGRYQQDIYLREDQSVCSSNKEGIQPGKYSITLKVGNKISTKNFEVIGK